MPGTTGRPPWPVPAALDFPRTERALRCGLGQLVAHTAHTHTHATPLLHAAPQLRHMPAVLPPLAHTAPYHFFEHLLPAHCAKLHQTGRWALGFRRTTLADEGRRDHS